MRTARNGHCTKEMEIVAQNEKVDVEFIRRGIEKGRIIITKSNRRELDNPLGIGKGLLVKINANVGSSKTHFDIDEEVEKAKIAVKFGADTVMDLSTGVTEADVISIRKRILDEVKVPLGTVPIYQTALRALENKGAIIHMDEDDMFHVIEEQAREGIDFFTIHAGISQEIVNYLIKHPRLMGVVSRGGTFLASWIIENNMENPYNRRYDYLLEMAQEYDFTLSLGDGMRPGSIFDSTDFAQVQELLEISKLVKRAWAADVQVMVEGPGHIPANEIERNIKLQKSLCDEAPFYPAEHLGLPTIADVKRGVISSKIAAHAVNIARYGKRVSDWDYRMDIARKELNWEGMIEQAIDPELAREIHYRNGCAEDDEEVCSMCGEFCAIKLLKDTLESKRNSTL